MGCEAEVRASLENAYRDVSAIAVKTCQMDGERLKEVTVRGQRRPNLNYLHLTHINKQIENMYLIQICSGKHLIDCYICEIVEEMCDMKKAKMCLTGMFDAVAMTTVATEAVDNKKLCR